MLYTEVNTDPLESFLTRLLNDAVQEAANDVVKETVRELARSYVDYKHHEVVYDDLFRDFMDEIGPSLVYSFTAYKNGTAKTLDLFFLHVNDINGDEKNKKKTNNMFPVCIL